MTAESWPEVRKRLEKEYDYKHKYVGAALTRIDDLEGFIRNRIARIKCRCDIVTMLPAGITECTGCEARRLLGEER